MRTVTEFLNILASKGVKLSAEAGQLNCYAQKGTLTSDIQAGIIKYKLELIALLEGRGEKLQTETNNGGSRKVKEFPLSAGQKGLYILQTVYPGMSAYNVPLGVRLGATLDVDLLEKAWSCALEQYPILTTRIIEKEGRLCHYLDDGCKTTIQRRAIEQADEQEVLSLLWARAKQPFDLNRGPLVRVDLFTQADEESILLITIHHIIYDGVSANLLLGSLFSYYNQLCEGKPARVSHNLPGYQEFVAWEEAMLASPEGRSHAEYWRRQLSGELPRIELFPDLPSSAASDYVGATLLEDLPEDLSRWVRDFTRAHSLRPSAMFLTIFQLLLQRYANQEDIIVGMPVIVRPAKKFAAEIGYFMNMVPLRTQRGGKLKFTEFLRATQSVMLDAIYHSGYPFENMLENVKSKQAAKNPIFQVNYAYQNFIDQAALAQALQRQTLKMSVVPELGPEGYSDFALEIYEREVSFGVL